MNRLSLLCLLALLTACDDTSKISWKDMEAYITVSRDIDLDRGMGNGIRVAYGCMSRNLSIQDCLCENTKYTTQIVSGTSFNAFTNNCKKLQ